MPIRLEICAQLSMVCAMDCATSKKLVRTFSDTTRNFPRKLRAIFLSLSHGCFTPRKATVGNAHKHVVKQWATGKATSRPAMRERPALASPLRSSACADACEQAIAAQADVLTAGSIVRMVGGQGQRREHQPSTTRKSLMEGRIADYGLTRERGVRYEVCFSRWLSCQCYNQPWSYSLRRVLQQATHGVMVEIASVVSCRKGQHHIQSRAERHGSSSIVIGIAKEDHANQQTSFMIFCMSHALTERNL
jgi:hypothetical protein